MVVKLMLVTSGGVSALLAYLSFRGFARSLFGDLGEIAILVALFSVGVLALALMAAWPLALFMTRSRMPRGFVTVSAILCTFLFAFPTHWIGSVYFDYPEQASLFTLASSAIVLAGLLWARPAASEEGAP